MNQDTSILSTRPLNKTLIETAQQTGIAITEEIFIETKPSISKEIKKRIIDLANQEVTVIFTSVNAVNAVFTEIESIPDWKMFCISGATQQALLAFVKGDAIIDTAMNGAALAEKILLHKEIKSLVFFCGNKRMNTMPDKLLRNGFGVEEIIVYETFLTPKFMDSTFDGVLFFSPSAVKSFFSMNKIEDKTILFSVGKTTTKAIREFTKNRIISAPFPSAESVMKEVKKHFISDAGSENF